MVIKDIDEIKKIISNYIPVDTRRRLILLINGLLRKQKARLNKIFKLGKSKQKKLL